MEWWSLGLFILLCSIALLVIAATIVWCIEYCLDYKQAKRTPETQEEDSEVYSEFDS